MANPPSTASAAIRDRVIKVAMSRLQWAKVKEFTPYLHPNSEAKNKPSVESGTIFSAPHHVSHLENLLHAEASQQSSQFTILDFTLGTGLKQAPEAARARPHPAKGTD